MLTNIRQARRRAISVGPQSEADAYEALAYRQQRRREGSFSERTGSANDGRYPKQDGANPSKTQGTGRGLAEYEHMMGSSSPKFEQTTERRRANSATTANGPTHSLQNEEEEDMFSLITRPRVRYDVEVVTKLIVYSGMSRLVGRPSFNLSVSELTCSSPFRNWMALRRGGSNPVLLPWIEPSVMMAGLAPAFISSFLESFPGWGSADFLYI
jgi:hypothetical protein